MTTLTFSDNASVITSTQKDEEYIEHIHLQASLLFQKLFGPQKWFTFKPFIKSLSSFIYYSTTHLNNLLTLGEEYTSIIQLDKNGTQLKMVPFSRRLLFAIIHSFSPLIIEKLLFRYITNENNFDLKSAKDLIEKLKDLNLILFYTFGTYSRIADRLLNLKYYSFGPNNDNYFANRFLSFFATLQFILNVIVTFRLKEIKDEMIIETASNGQSEPLNEKQRCSLCWGIRVDDTATLCGHLFCWKCICRWIAIEPFCPICRFKINNGNELIFAKNL